MKAYKGFNKDLQCTPNRKVFQYEIGKEYDDPISDLCSCGFHACENPIDVFGYYSPADSRFCEVELDNVQDNHDSDDSKICGSHIKIGVEIGLKGLIEASVKFILDKVDWKNAKESNTGYQSAATNTGYQSAATNTGNYSAATNTGYQSAATVEGKESVAISLGVEGKAKGALNCFLILSEWKQDDNYDWHRVAVKSHKVDGKTIKSDTYYTLKSGKFTEVK